MIQVTIVCIFHAVDAEAQPVQGVCKGGCG